MSFWGSFSGRLEVGAYTFLGIRSGILVNLSGNMNLGDLGIKWEARRRDYWGSKSRKESEF